MNKKLSQGVVVGALALFLTLMVGYALFSQNLTITGTAKAEGNLEITPTCTLGIPSEIDGTISEKDKVPERGYGTDSENNYCTVSGNTVTFAMDFKVDNARRYATVAFKNTGDIDAVIPVEYDIDQIKWKTCIDGYDMQNKTNTSLNGTFEETECNSASEGAIVEPGEFVALKGTDGQVIATSDDTKIAGHMDDAGENYILKPGELIYFNYLSRFDIDPIERHYPNSISQSNFNVQEKIEQTFKFEQYVK